MFETAEGIGGRKWSLLQMGDVHVMQGVTHLATLTRDGESVKELLVTAPQLWSEANEVLKHRSATTPEELKILHAALARLENMVAKAVGKTDWKDVLQ